MASHFYTAEPLTDLLFRFVCSTGLAHARIYHWGEMTGSGARFRAKDSTKLTLAGITLAKVESNSDGIVAMTSTYCVLMKYGLLSR
jgi:hypothetical protein